MCVILVLAGAEGGGSVAITTKNTDIELYT